MTMQATPRTGAGSAESQGWSATLTLAAVGCLGFLTLSGFAIWLLPFGPFTQWSVLLHTGVGVLALLPVGWYLLRHWRAYWRHPVNDLVLLGYAATLLLVVCLVSGVVVTWQALLAVRTDEFWRLTHRWSTVGVLVFTAWHVVGVVWRVRQAVRGEGAGRRLAGARQFGTGVAMAAIVPLALLAATMGVQRLRAVPDAFPAGYEMWETDNPLYADNRPFAPSLARTADNGPLAEWRLAGSEGCGTAGCHQQILKEWQPSAHRYAAMDKSFQAIQLTMAQQNGPTSTRYCAGCHDPISLFAGAKTIVTSDAELTGSPGYHEGISCLSCHAVRQTDIRGNAQYTVQAPPRYIGEREYDAAGATGWRLVRDFLIRSYPQPHVDGLSKVMFKQPEYCAACHKQFIDEEVNNVGWVQLQNQFDNWKMSKWARDRSSAGTTVECRECHMPLVDSTDPSAGDRYDYNRSPRDGRHRSHRFLGANQFMPDLLGLEGAEEQTALTHAWLRGEIAIPEIESKWKAAGTPIVSIQLVAPSSVRAGEPVTVQCIITSNKVGHDFPTGPLDIIQSWIEIVARDDSGQVVFESGTLDDRGFVQPGAFVYKAEPIDQYGNPIDRHNLWEMVGVRSRRALFPGFSDTASFTWTTPAATGGPTAGGAGAAGVPGRLEIVARLRYRKVDQFLLNYLRSVGFFPEFADRPLTAPVTDLHEARAIVEVR
jgi:hypothetical protein